MKHHRCKRYRKGTNERVDPQGSSKRGFQKRVPYRGVSLDADFLVCGNVGGGLLECDHVLVVGQLDSAVHARFSGSGRQRRCVEKSGRWLRVEAFPDFDSCSTGRGMSQDLSCKTFGYVLLSSRVAYQHSLCLNSITRVETGGCM